MIVRHEEHNNRGTGDRGIETRTQGTGRHENQGTPLAVRDRGMVAVRHEKHWARETGDQRREKHLNREPGDTSMMRYGW